MTEPVSCIVMKDGFQYTSFQTYHKWHNVVLEFDSNTIPIFPSYISFNIGNNKLYYISNKTRDKHIFVFNDDMYRITQDLFIKVINNYYNKYKNNASIIYNEYDNEPFIHANEVSDRENILMINILSKYECVSNNKEDK